MLHEVINYKTNAH